MNFKVTKQLSMVLLALFSLQGCVDYRDDPVCSEFDYMTFEEFRAKGIEVLAPREIKEAGKIYVYNNTLLVIEKNQGVHVIDNSDTKNPKPKAFIKVDGNLDMAVKEGYLYLDSYMDLLVLDIRDLEHIKELKRVNDSFTYDPYQNYYVNGCDFNMSNGLVVGGDR